MWCVAMSGAVRQARRLGERPRVRRVEYSDMCKRQFPSLPAPILPAQRYRFTGLEESLSGFRDRSCNLKPHGNVQPAAQLDE
jgi:hypothetical protein